MGRKRTGRVAAAAAVAVLAATGIAAAATTEDRTIQDSDGDNRLEYAAGDSRLLRQDLGTASPGRAGTRAPLLAFGQLTDLHIVDEESPARVEFLDKVGPPFTSAYRPHEGITTQVADEMVRAMRTETSPVTGRRMDVVMTTGDNTDNTQCNETRWMIDLLDGAGNAGGGALNCLPPGLRPRGGRIDPNSGVEDSCGLRPDGRLYDGVRGGGEYYEPDFSGPPGPASEDGPGYSPDEAENEAEAERSSSVRDFPGLFERMNEPFDPAGFGRLRWYGIFGNHDGLVQGNQPRNAALDAIAQGCVKVTALPPGDLQQARALLASGDSAGAVALIERRFREVAERRDLTPGLAEVVPADVRRHLLLKREYIAQHFVTTGAPRGHGFGPENVATGQGNYAFHPRRGLRFVVLDTVAENGGDGGNVDDAQFRWIHRELLEADRAGELALVFAHHSLETMNQPPVSPFPPGDQGGNNDPNVHVGERSRSEACPPRGPAAEPTADETLKCLMLRHPSTIAFVTGHEHQNRIRAVPRSGVDGDPAGPVSGGFWQVVTASHIDWPQQSRLLDVVDNRDGTLSIFGTLLDHEAPPEPGEDGSSTRELASISRELSFNDPDSENGEDARNDARGGDDDRNVELIVRDPRGEGGDGEGDGDGDDEGGDDDEDSDDDEDTDDD